MLLAIDVGNTNTVLGIFDGEKLLASWRMKSDARDTSDELWVQYQSLVSDYDFDSVAICSTVPAILREIRQMVNKNLADKKVTIVEPGIKTGVPLDRKSTRLNSSHVSESRMPSSA